MIPMRLFSFAELVLDKISATEKWNYVMHSLKLSLGFVFLYELYVEMHLLSSKMICSSRREPFATEVDLLW